MGSRIDSNDIDKNSISMTPFCHENRVDTKFSRERTFWSYFWLILGEIILLILFCSLVQSCKPSSYFLLMNVLSSLYSSPSTLTATTVFSFPESLCIPGTHFIQPFEKPKNFTKLYTLTQFREFVNTRKSCSCS